MDLPIVSLDPAALCPGTAHPPAGGAPHAGRQPAPGDARYDARTDGRPDGPGDGRADAQRGGVLVVPDHTDPFRPPLGWRSWITVRHWALQWWRSARKAATNPRGPYHAQPESLAAHDAYRRVRAWIPAGHEGKILGPAGDAYHLTFAKFGMATGYWLAWTFARPMRLLITVAVLGGIALGFWIG
jgi:hypothetical protein